ncbi:hypothetical protein [Peribacillus sp. NPDC060253]|uniref:hypothetical protein n=1 Tax=Peribacillus sp. NPDC060253 TaxID=3347084 RepID=UPI00365F6E4C
MSRLLLYEEDNRYEGDDFIERSLNKNAFEIIVDERENPANEAIKARQEENDGLRSF